MQDIVRVYIKGAPEIVIPNCLNHYNENGQKTPMNDVERDYLLDTLKNKMTSIGHRPMAFSMHDFSLSQFESLVEQTENFKDESGVGLLAQNQTFLALVALEDPLRDNIKDSLGYAPLSGITVRVCSGDNLDTTKAVAIQAGVITE